MAPATETRPRRGEFTAPDRGLTFIDDLLAEEQLLSAVEAFARQHSNRSEPAPGRYRRLLPATSPAPGQQYAFEVDLDLCSGCKACVTACHSLNGLDENESWRSVGLLVSPAAEAAPPLQQHVTTACHHCVDPACLNGCPVLAYEKDPLNGIVRHLDDQCMGCSYCVMKCPYEVPRYSTRLGIVRKCDLCRNRLAADEAPACAQACPGEAIRITVVDRAELQQRYALTIPSHPRSGASNGFLADAPDPTLTIPSTSYVSRRDLGGSSASDRAHLRLEPAHDPLVAMLVLTQASAGLWMVSAVAGATGLAGHFAALNSTALALLMAGLAASVLHLGRPAKAWRAFLGWRRSWLSREIIAFQLGALASVIAATGAWVFRSAPTTTAGTTVAAIIGAIGVGTSSMVYIDTARPFWRPRFTLISFFGTTARLGLALAGAIFLWLGLGHTARFDEAAWWSNALGLGVGAALTAWRGLEFRRARADEASSIHWNARVMGELLGTNLRCQFGLFVGAMGAAWVALAARPGPGACAAATLSAGLAAAAEWMARRAYFQAGGSRRMPGGPPS